MLFVIIPVDSYGLIYRKRCTESISELLIVSGPWWLYRMSDHGDRAVGYVRVSTLRQAEGGNSIASQTLSLQRYARNRGPVLNNRMGIREPVLKGI